MKAVAVIARILLGLMFFVFGMDTLIYFVPAMSPTTGLAGAFLGSPISSHYVFYVFFIGGVQLIAATLLLSNQFVPLALILLAPVLANIVVFHLAMQPGGSLPGLFAVALWLVVVSRLRAYFAPLFVQKAVLS